MRFKTFKIKKPKYIWLAFNVFSVTSETSEQTKICAWAEKQAYLRWNGKPFYSGYVIGHEKSQEA